jgi:hypothetical protein|tara:strand:- start:92 stop:211 length:120 start_codon:yes stop_codon:yes gene_type:complete
MMYLLILMPVCYRMSSVYGAQSKAQSAKRKASVKAAAYQ